MQSISINQLSWPQFSHEYKLIKNIHSSSFYSPFSLYLNIRTKQKYLIKQIAFQNSQQMQIILEEIKKANQSLKMNNRQYLCKITGFCIKVSDKQQSRISNSRRTSFINKQGKILLLFEHFKTLQEIIQSVLLSPNEHSFIQGDSEIVTIKNYPYTSSIIAERTLINILKTLISTIIFIKQHEIEFVKSFTLQMIQIQNFGSVDQKCRVFFYPVADKDIAEMVWNQQFLIQDSYVGQKVLQSINRFQTNEFRQIRLQNNERQSFSVSKKSEESNSILQQLSQQNICQSLLQSVGLLILKISSLSLGKDTFLQTKFYKMNEKYQLALNFQTIEYLLTSIRRNGIYSRNFVEKIQKLIYQNENPEIINELLKSQSFDQNFKEKDYSPLKERKTFSIGKVPVKQKKSIGMNLNLTPSKKIGIQMCKLMNISGNQLNQTLKQKNSYQNPRSKSKSQTNSRSNSIMRDKSRLLSSVSKPKQFSPSLVQKSLRSSSKKSLSPSQGINKNTSISINNRINGSSQRQVFIETLKQKILYDPNTGVIHDNIISKQFRDGSTYLGQYNPPRNIKQGYGLYFYFDGDIYGGTWKNDQLNGLGIYYFANGDSYQGGVVNGQKDGYGIYKYGNGNIYKGQWKNDKKQGKGEFIYGNGDIYVGQFVEGRKQGHGVYKWTNGDIYEGNFTKNMKHGFGRFQKANTQHTIEGKWQNDSFVDEQEARIFYGQSDKFYQGKILQNGVIEGYGTYHFNKDSYYQGQIINNKYEGECAIHYENGDIYKGQIKNNIFQGYGEYYFAQKNFKYMGSWLNGKQHGLGQLLYVMEGTIIKTMWQNGCYGRHKAVVIYKDGSRYEGDINQNGKHGRGKYIYPDGKWIEGQYDSNKLVHLYQISE